MGNLPKAWYSKKDIRWVESRKVETPQPTHSLASGGPPMEHFKTKHSNKRGCSEMAIDFVVVSFLILGPYVYERQYP